MFPPYENFFISDGVINNVIKEKKEKQLGYSSILLFILTSIKDRDKNNREINFVCSEGIFDILETEWKERENEPAWKRMAIKIKISNKYASEDANFLDTVSDITLACSPNHSCFLVSSEEYERVFAENMKLNFQGFEITTPEKILSKLGVYPFGIDFTSKILKAIEDNC